MFTAEVPQTLSRSFVIEVPELQAKLAGHLHVAGQRSDAGPLRFQLEFADPIKPAEVRERLREALGFGTVAQLGRAGVTVTATSPRARSCLQVTLIGRAATVPMTGAQLTAVLRAAAGPARVAKMPRTDFARFRRVLHAAVGATVTASTSIGDVSTSTSAVRASVCAGGTGCCCCCRRDRDAGYEPPAARPTWTSVPDDTEWHLAHMRVKEAWDVAPPRSGRSRGEGVVIAHADTGWREHPETVEERLRFDLARNLIDGGQGRDATRHSTLTVFPVLFQAHGTGTGVTIVTDEADPRRTHVTDIPFEKLIPTSSRVELSGIAPRANLVPIRCTDTTILLMDPNLERAVEHSVDVGAHVLSISLGGERWRG